MKKKSGKKATTKKKLRELELKDARQIKGGTSGWDLKQNVKT